MPDTCPCREALEKIILPRQTRSLDSNYYRIQIIAREALDKPCGCEEWETMYLGAKVRADAAVERVRELTAENARLVACFRELNS
jgi:hypothetical protein